MKIKLNYNGPERCVLFFSPFFNVYFRAERSATQSLRQQQDRAYEESLRADQEKDRKREEERKAREEQEAREKEQLNAQELEIQRIRLEKELTIDKVPLEPEPTNPNACHLQIKVGERTMKRRFLMSNTVEVISNISPVCSSFKRYTKYKRKRCILFFSSVRMFITGYSANLIPRRVSK